MKTIRDNKKHSSDPKSYLVLNYIVTTFWLLILVTLMMRSSTQIADETLILGRWSFTATAAIGSWAIFGLAHLFLFTRTRVGRAVFRTDVLFTVFSLALFLLIAECSARALNLFPPNAAGQVTESTDPILGSRFKPDVIGHDANGWRNTMVPEKVDWLFLGDSMTYGAGVNLDEAYPHVIGVLSNRETYNLSLGGFGPAEYLHIYRQFGRQLSPEYVVLGITLANDLFDLTAAQTDRWVGLDIDTSSVVIDTENPTNVRYAFAAYQEMSAISPKPIERLIRGTHELINWHSSLARAVIAPPARIRREHDWFKMANVSSSEKVGALHPDIQWIGQDPPYFVYSDKQVSTVFTPTRRLIPVELSFPTIRAATDVTMDIVSTLKGEVEANNARLVIVLIPTKEEVYFEYLRSQGVSLPASYLALMKNTYTIKTQLADFARTTGSCLLDTGPMLSSAASNGEQIYFHDSDGHPTATGHTVIASYLVNELRDLERGEACH